MQQLVLFESALPDCQASEKLVEPIDEKKLVSLLLSAQSLVERKIFEYAPIDCKKISEAAGNKALKPGELAAFVSGISLSKLEQQLDQFVTAPKNDVPEDQRKKEEARRKAYAEITVLCYLKAVLDKSIPPVEAKLSGKPAKKEVRLVANTSNWQIVKKASLEAERKETFMGLVGINASLVRKIEQSLGAPRLEQYISSFLSKFPQRKSIGRLAEILSAINEAELDRVLRESVSEQNFKAAKRFFYCKAFEHAGFPPFVGTEVANEAYPELKIPKPRGNYGSKKGK